MEETNKHKCRLEDIEQHTEQNENNTLYKWAVAASQYYIIYTTRKSHLAVNLLVILITMSKTVLFQLFDFESRGRDQLTSRGVGIRPEESKVRRGHEKG